MKSTHCVVLSVASSFESSPTHIGMGTMRRSYGIDACFAFIDQHFVLRQTATSPTIAKKDGKGARLRSLKLAILPCRLG